MLSSTFPYLVLLQWLQTQHLLYLWGHLYNPEAHGRLQRKVKFVSLTVLKSTALYSDGPRFFLSLALNDVVLSRAPLKVCSSRTSLTSHGRLTSLVTHTWQSKRFGSLLHEAKWNLSRCPSTWGSMEAAEYTVVAACRSVDILMEYPTHTGVNDK